MSICGFATLLKGTSPVLWRCSGTFTYNQNPALGLEPRTLFHSPFPSKYHHHFLSIFVFAAFLYHVCFVGLQVFALLSAIATFFSCICFISLCIFPVFAARLLFCSAFASVGHHMEPQLGSHSCFFHYVRIFFLHIIKFSGVCCHYSLGLLDGGQVLFKIRYFFLQ